MSGNTLPFVWFWHTFGLHLARAAGPPQATVAKMRCYLTGLRTASKGGPRAHTHMTPRMTSIIANHRWRAPPRRSTRR